MNWCADFEAIRFEEWENGLGVYESFKLLVKLANQFN
jgi:hypothetical protein